MAKFVYLSAIYSSVDEFEIWYTVQRDVWLLYGVFVLRNGPNYKLSNFANNTVGKLIKVFNLALSSTTLREYFRYPAA